MSEKVLIPIIISGENPCGSCVGACCRAGTAMELDDDEHDFITEGGTQIIRSGRRTESEVLVELRERLGDLMGMVSGVISDGTIHPEYFFTTDCAYMVQNSLGQLVCSQYDHPRRPNVCSSFTPGTEICDRMLASRQNQPLMPPTAP